MNKIVRNYPASNLPADLREGVDPNARVTVTVEVSEDTPPHRPMTLDEIFAARRPPFRTRKKLSLTCGGFGMKRTIDFGGLPRGLSRFKRVHLVLRRNRFGFGGT
jgi:hypothetical protein